jgi:hypothetical protein
MANGGSVWRATVQQCSRARMVMKSALEAMRCSVQTTKSERRKRVKQNVDNQALTELKRECMGKKERVMGCL